MHGWLLLDKPEGMTSTRAVSACRRLLEASKAGHAGTLDPLATGVLPIAFGEATKTVGFAMGHAKTYRFTIRWGEARDTDDREGAVIEASSFRPDRSAVEAALPGFIGKLWQRPPRFSAIKVAGERAYHRARAGDDVEVAARFVHVKALRLLNMPDADHAEIEAVCEKGTYMRSLARDLAHAVGTVGHVTALRRLSVGPFRLDDAVSVAHLQLLAQRGETESVLKPVEAPLDDIPAVTLSEQEAYRMRCGQPVALLRRSDRETVVRIAANDENAMVLARLGSLPVALARLQGAALYPVRVLNL